MSGNKEQKGKDEETVIHEQVVEWVKNHDAHFKRNCKPLYDEANLEKRIKRFANAPIDYIDERIALNKKVSENYHKFHHSILLAGITAFITILLAQVLMKFLETSELWYLGLLISLIIGSVVATKIRPSYTLLRWMGLLRVIRDSEIEIYYLSKIKENRRKDEGA